MWCWRCPPAMTMCATTSLTLVPSALVTASGASSRLQHRLDFGGPLIGATLPTRSDHHGQRVFAPSAVDTASQYEAVERSQPRRLLESALSWVPVQICFRLANVHQRCRSRSLSQLYHQLHGSEYGSGVLKFGMPLTAIHLSPNSTSRSRISLSLLRVLPSMLICIPRRLDTSFSIPFSAAYTSGNLSLIRPDGRHLRSQCTIRTLEFAKADVLGKYQPRECKSRRQRSPTLIRPPIRRVAERSRDDPQLTR